MTILVAGATGLVGSAIVRNLKKDNIDFLGISSSDVNLLDREATFAFIKDCKPSVIIDAAAKVGGIQANNDYSVEFLSENIRIQCNLMDAAHNFNVEKFVFLGSSCVYPRNANQPIKESYLLTGELESTNSAYAIAKIAGLELIKSYRSEYAHNWISVMPANVYGPNDNFNLQDSHVFPALIRKFIEAKKSNLKVLNLWGTGNPKREFLHVDDLARGIIFCLEKYNGDSPINIGTGVDLSISELAKKIAAQTEFDGEIKWDSSKPDGTPRKVLDVSKINELGWKHTIDLDEGIKQTIAWFEQTSEKRV
jgi:GDP-L-fucose synthase